MGSEQYWLRDPRGPLILEAIALDALEIPFLQLVHSIESGEKRDAKQASELSGKASRNPNRLHCRSCDSGNVVLSHETDIGS